MNAHATNFLSRTGRPVGLRENGGDRRRSSPLPYGFAGRGLRLNPVAGQAGERRRLPVPMMLRFQQGPWNAMSTAETTHASVPDGTAASGDSHEGTPASRPLADAVRAVQMRLGPKAAEQLAGITGQDAKT